MEILKKSSARKRNYERVNDIRREMSKNKYAGRVFQIETKTRNFYDKKGAHVAVAIFRKQKNKYYVQFVDRYFHDDVYVDDVDQFKLDKGFLEDYQLDNFKE